MAVCFRKVTFCEAKKIDGIEQISFSHTIVAINTYDIFVEMKILLQVIFKLVNS
jgi:hypothetical protein